MNSSRVWGIWDRLVVEHRLDGGPRSEATGSDATQRSVNGIELSVVVPTLNEAESIEATLDRIYAGSPLAAGAFEVIVVDESDDATPAVVESLEHPELGLLEVERGLGLARSVITGFEASRGRFVGVIDADGQHPPEKLFELYETAADGPHDVVVASRYAEGGAIPNWSAYRRLVSLGATWIAQLLLLRNVDIDDPMSGFFVVRRSLIEGVELKPIGYKILLDILVRTDPTVTEVGYVFADRADGTSSLDYAEYLRYVRHVLALLRYRLRS